MPPRWQRDAANPAGGDASAPFLRLRRAQADRVSRSCSVDACTASECPTSALSLCRRVRPVLLIAILFICSAASAKPRGVTLDVKDADVHVVLKSIKKECEIKSLISERVVSGSGAFPLHSVPCKVALETVLRV